MKYEDIALLLPEIIRRTVPQQPDNTHLLSTLLEIMEVLHTPSEVIMEQIDDYFDPYHTPSRFVPYLASWVDLDSVWLDDATRFTAETVPEFPTGTGRLRNLIANAVYLSSWRGTSRGLLAFLEIATGVIGFHINENVLDETGQYIPFHILVTIPYDASIYRTLIQRIVELEKPAYVTYDLEIEKIEKEGNSHGNE